MDAGRGAAAAGEPPLLGGIDEAGRGPLAGPVVAAVVLLAPDQVIDGVCDSKALLPARRSELAKRVAAECLDWGIGMATVAEIDRMNILNATLLAMGRAFAGLQKATPRRLPALVQVDGNQLPWLPGYVGRLEAVVGGDSSCHAVSAASILAKVHRDDYMVGLHGRWPQYGFDQHKGYSTPAHLQALKAHGPCPLHRRSFAPVRVAEWYLA